MPNWTQIRRELNDSYDDQGSKIKGLDVDELRAKYLKKFSDYTKRNVIAYYSGFFKNTSTNTGIDDYDLEGFMNAINGMDTSKGLDLILHTPGGSPEATEGIVKYLHSKFGNDIRVFIPHMAMSAGTMLACCGKEIIMGKHSFLGPIDPQIVQLNCSVSAFNVIREFDSAKEDIEKTQGRSTQYWAIFLQKYTPGVYSIANDSIKLSHDLVFKWLRDNMFADEDDDETKNKIDKILDTLNQNNQSHGRHFNIDECREMGLKITALEDDPELQDDLLSIHHAFTISIDLASPEKLIENQDNGHFIIVKGTNKK